MLTKADLNRPFVGESGHPDYPMCGNQGDATLPRLAQELLDRSPDALFTVGTLAAHAIRQGTSTIPIVLFGGEDAISEGLAGTLSRPGGNVTGVVILSTSLHGKRIELLHEMIPTMQHVAVLLFRRSGEGARSEIRTRGGREPCVILCS
jgi:ABC-type uncharacterized transport system substrate-binding protein